MAEMKGGPGAEIGSGKLFTEILRTLPLTAAVFDREMRYLAHTRDWPHAHGRPDEASLVGQSHYEVFEISAEWKSVHVRCLAGATERSDLDEFTGPDGKRRFVRWVATPWGEGPGRIDGLIVYVEDITEQVATQRKLAEREALIGDLFEKSPVGLNLCTMDGLWLQSNAAFCEIIGYSQKEADSGLTYWQLTPRKYDALEQVQLEKLRTTRRYGPYEKEFIRKDGSLVPVRLNGFLVEREGQTYIWSLIEDLTAQRALEADLEAERLKAIQASKLATVGEMAASIAHELNNPLGIIDAFAFVLADPRTRASEEKTAEAVRAIRDAVTRAGKIVHGLRKFTRTTTGEAPCEVVVGEVVDEALDLCAPRLRKDGIDLSVQVRTTARVLAHQIELGQVLVNLVTNAADAVGASDRKWIRVAAEDSPSGVRISVEDSGPGIPPEIATDLFRAFFTTKPVGEGTGLGLSISRSIVERCGGTIVVDSSAPHTRFVIDLPRVSA